MKIPVAVLLLISLFFAGGLVTWYTHCHVDADGRVVCHAHPFQNAGTNQTAPFAAHTHSRTEFASLAIVHQLLMSFLLLCCGYLFVALKAFAAAASVIDVSVRPRIFQQSISRRGPPLSA